MILDVYPSSKDTEMVDLLYEFERDTRLSLNIIVENFLEKMLYDEGYLGKESDEKLEFETKYASSGYEKIVYGELSFGMHKPENIEMVIEKLSKVPPEQLPEFSKNNWDDRNGQYSKFLEAKLSDPLISVDEYLQKKEMKLTIGYSPSKKRHYINNGDFSFGKYHTEDEVLIVKEYLVNLSYDEFQKLKDDVRNCGENRRNYMLKICGRK